MVYLACNFTGTRSALLSELCRNRRGDIITEHRTSSKQRLKREISARRLKFGICVLIYRHVKRL